MRLQFQVSAVLAFASLTGCVSQPEPSSNPAWESLFDGQTLNGWTVKIAGQQLGEDAENIFRVENGQLVVSYDAYDAFSGEFGHLFYNEPLSDYRLRVTYAFQESQVPGGPNWAFMNSGVMVHAQAPETLRVDQPFPISVEAQLLGRSDITPTRTTANMCSPGTHVVIDGALTKQHCVNSQTAARSAGEWAVFELEVRGGDLISLSIDGEEAFRLTDPVYDTSDPDVQALGLSGPVTQGHIALQAESHAVTFKDIELLRLDAASR
ncbi:MAG: DUF1080 domain-containing protein [Hyphomonas sp.]|nr:DUF1080 domain-containing protein [Hyphomonas sp.]